MKNPKKNWKKMYEEEHVLRMSYGREIDRLVEALKKRQIVSEDERRNLVRSIDELRNETNILLPRIEAVQSRTRIVEQKPVNKDRYIKDLKTTIQLEARENERLRVEVMHQKELQAHEIQFRQFATKIAENLSKQSKIIAGNLSYEEYSDI